MILFIGAFYADNTKPSDKLEDRVQKGQNVTLIWKLTAEFAPKDDDPSCLPFAYHSHNNPDMEVNSGLLGLLLVCKQGKTRFLKVVCYVVWFCVLEASIGTVKLNYNSFKDA